VWSPSPRKTDRTRFAAGLRLAMPLALAATLRVAHAGEVGNAVLTLEALSGPSNDQLAASLPLHFALLEDGQVFVGGTSQLLAGRLSKDEMAVFERRMSDVRKLPGLTSSVTFGPGTSVRLAFRKPKPLEVLIQGDPAAAPPGLLPLASLVSDLARFGHASLRPYEPGGYALSVREGKLTGGCRSWTLPVPLADAAGSPRLLPATSATGWPTGATPAQVCSGEKTYVVTFRPLVPGEKP
jgi:hypothetical protein